MPGETAQGLTVPPQQRSTPWWPKDWMEVTHSSHLSGSFNWFVMNDVHYIVQLCMCISMNWFGKNVIWCHLTFWVKWRFLPRWDHTPNVHLSFFGFRHSQMIYEQKTAAPPGTPWQTIQDQNTFQQPNSLSEPCYNPVSQNGSWPKWFPPVTFPKLE